MTVETDVMVTVVAVGAADDDTDVVVLVVDVAGYKHEQALETLVEPQEAET